MSGQAPLLYPAYEFGGDGPPIHLSVASGFPPQTYAPLIEPLTARYRAISVLPRALWPDPPAPESFKSWQELADDLLGGLRERNLSDVIAIGHSMGGVASMLAALAEPQRFKALILLDPTFLPPRIATLIHFLRIIGRGRHFPLAQETLLRRAEFASVEEAYEHWKARALFRDWPDRTVRLYAESMTRPKPDRSGLELAWSPLWEARYYETIDLNWATEVKKLRGLLPVLAVQGARTDAFVNTSVKITRRLLPEASIRRIEHHGHLFPQSAPDETRQVIDEWLSVLPARLKG